MPDMYEVRREVRRELWRVLVLLKQAASANEDKRLTAFDIDNVYSALVQEQER